MISERVNRLKGIAGGGDKWFQNLSVSLCREMHWGYKTLMSQPIPFVLLIVESMKKEQEEMNKKTKKKGR